MASLQEQAEQQSSFDPAKIYVWVKALEGKVNNLIRELNLIKNDTIKKSKRQEDDLKQVNQELLDVKHQQDQMLKKMDIIIKELQKTAGIEQLQTLQKYVDFWNPINFVTQRDVERIIEQKMEDKKNSKKAESNPSTRDSALSTKG